MSLLNIFSKFRKITPDLTEKQKWALGVSAIFAEVRGQDHHSIKGYLNTSDKKALEIVSDSFGKA